MLKIVAGTAIGLVVYSYLIYPVVLAILAACVQLLSDLHFVIRKLDRRPWPVAIPPSVAVVFSAFNEEAHVRQRIENILALNYPDGCLTIHAGSDGSDDRTADILGEFASDRIRIYSFENNRGKAGVLNELLAQITAEFVVFTDANVRFHPDSVARLIAHFQDPRVGAVSGELRLLSKGGDNQDGLYWRVEQLLKFFESRIGGLLGANGAIYAIRRSAWQPLAVDTICDDFCIAMNVAVKGFRLNYEPAAWAVEMTPATIGDEYRRRVRIGIGNFQCLFRTPRYLTHISWATSFSYLSHKVLRWIGPHLLIIGFGFSVAAADSAGWACFAVFQALAYLVSGLAYLASSRGWELPIVLRIPGFFFALNCAFLTASLRYSSGRFSGAWQTTPR